MKRFAQRVQDFLVSEEGPTAVEYAVMLALIVIACIAGITTLGSNTSGMFNTVATELGNVSGGGGGS